MKIEISKRFGKRVSMDKMKPDIAKKNQGRIYSCEGSDAIKIQVVTIILFLFLIITKNIN
jgi:hypothetical protein